MVGRLGWFAHSKVRDVSERGIARQATTEHAVQERRKEEINIKRELKTDKVWSSTRGQVREDGNAGGAFGW
jgi:hypothetical protein